MITDTGIRALSLVLIPNLIRKQILSFSCAMNPLTSEGVKALCVIIRNNPKIQRLWLGSTFFRGVSLIDINLDDEGLHDLCQAIIQNNCYSLVLLSLINNNITEKGIHELRSLFELNLFHITDFSLSNNAIGDAGFIALLNCMSGRNCVINRLYLRNIELTQVSMEHLQRALTTNDLSCTELGLTNNPIGNSGFDYLVDGLVESRCMIQCLWLFNAGLDGDSAPSFVKLIQSGLFENLLLLDIASNQLDYTAFSQIVAEVFVNNVPLRLEELWLGGCPLMDTGLVLITSLIQQGFLPNLHTLCMDSREMWGVMM